MLLGIAAGAAWTLYQNQRANAGGQANTPASHPANPLGTPAPTIAPAFFGTGVISFGTGYNAETLAITGATSRFAVGHKIAWSASLSDTANATHLTWIIAKTTSGGIETVDWTQDVPVSNPDIDTVANNVDLTPLLDGPGTYVMRYLRDATVLAEGPSPS